MRQNSLTLFLKLLLILSMVLPLLIVIQTASAAPVTISDPLTSGLGANTHLITGSFAPFGGWNFNDSTTLDSGQYTGGCGRIGGGCITSDVVHSGTTYESSLVVDLGAEYTLTAASFYYVNNNDLQSHTDKIILWDGTGAHLAEVSVHSSSSSSWRQNSWTGSEAGVRYITFFSDGVVSQGDPSYIDDLSVTYDDGTLGPAQFGTRPLAQVDQNTTFDLQDNPDTPVDIFDAATVLTQHTGSADLLQAISNAPGAYVHSMSPGTVTGIRPLDLPSDCGLYDPGDNHQIDGNANTAYCWVMLHNDGEHALLVEAFYAGYIVTVEYDDTDGKHWIFNYIVDQPSVYVSVGDRVSPGCVLGLTIALNPIIGINAANLGGYENGDNSPPLIPSGYSPVEFELALNNVTSGGQNPQAGFAGVLAFNETDSTYQRLAPTDYPNNDTPCKDSDQSYSDCLLSNPRFSNHGEGWTANDGVLFDADNVALVQSGGVLFRSMLLDSTKNYVLTAGLLESVPNTLEIFVESGTESHVEDFGGTDSGQLTLNSGTLSATQVYNIGVRAIGSAASPAIPVRFLCLTEGAPNTAPNQCYFNNSTFDFGLSGWDSTNATGDNGDGYTILGSPGTLAQTVHLFPAESGTQIYTLTVRFTGYSSGLYTPPPDPAKIHVSYVWDAGSVDVGDVPLGNFTTATAGVSHTFSVSAETSDTFTITVQFEESDDTPITSDDLLAKVTSACITPNTGTFPGYGGGTPPPFTADCERVDRPTDENLSSWTVWLWANLNRFFSCDLMAILSRIYQAILSFMRMVGYVLRFWMALVKQQTAWADKQLFPWLAGYFANIAHGSVTTIQQPGDSGCHDLFCLLSNLANIEGKLIDFLNNIINLAGQLLSLIINGIIGLIFLILGELFQLLNMALQMLAALINGYANATPTALPGIPDCGSIDPRTHWLCTAIWVLDNTVWAPGQAGALVIPIIVSAGSLFLLIWVVGQIFKTIEKVGALS
jgi:hypothetical protein